MTTSLTIKLAAPMQSYGDRSYSFTYKGTYRAPSKSAVLGMIAAALGYDKTNPYYQDKIRELNKLSFAVRVDQPGKKMTDYQVVKYRNGKKDDAKISYRDYLQDAVFVASIGSENTDFIHKIEHSLHIPKYTLFLGRMANVPAGVLQTKVFDNTAPVESLKKLEWQASTWFKKKCKSDKYQTQIIADAKLIKNDDFQLVQDTIGTLSTEKLIHKARRVAKTDVDLVNDTYKPLESHDVMAFL